MLGSVQRKLLVAVGATATLVLGGLIAFLTTQATGELGRAASERLQLKSERLGTALHGELVRYQKVAETLASAMERYQRQGASRTEASQMVRQVAAQNPKALGTYLAYEPDAFDGQDALHEADSASGSNPGGRFAPYWNRYGEGLGLSPLADLESQDWYTRPVESGEPLIKGPFVYDGKLMLSFLHPIERDGVPVGVGGVDVSVDYWQQRAREMQVQESGYAFIVSPNGKLVAHPNEQWAGTETLQSLGDSLSLSAFDQMDDHLSAGGGDQQFQFTDPVTGQEATAWLHSTETSGFAIGTVAPQAEMRAGAHYLRNVFLGIGLVSLLGLLGATYVLLRRWVIGPLSVVTEKVQAVAGGDRSVQIQNRWGDEFGTLAASFNDMTAQIRESRDHLQEEREKAQEKRREAARLAEASQEKSEFLRSELEELTGRIRRMAEGDLTVSFKTDRESASGSDTDEAAQLVGKLREALSTAVASMHSALQAVTTASEETATAVRQISSSSDQMAASAEEQSAQAEEVAAAVEELNQTIGENARAAQQVADA
ncbi:MAG: methyl-accepting chemotaxis protein, partial [Salinibacter sp.]|uniref:methyl-accepting chemotaxis protein n=1 Tax=Salinibacter sp. TaxID=2065818 RepID=UPI002FC31059